MTNTVNFIRNMIHGLNTPVKLDDNRETPVIYLDNAATTPPFKQVVEEIEKQLLHYGSIGRGKGQKSEHSTNIYVKGRDLIKKFVGADSDDYTVIYTECTTDGLNKLASALIESPDDIVLTTRMEHHANDLPWRERCKTVYAEVDSMGRLVLEDIFKLLEAHHGAIKYVCVTAASNVTGYVNDIYAIAELAHHYGAKIIVDGAQIVSHRSIYMLGDRPEETIDFFVFSAHKMYSPYGGGAIVGLKSVLDEHIPEFYGGGMVEVVHDDEVIYVPSPDSYEAGSPNYPGVVGMLKAIETLQFIGFGYIKRYEQYLMRLTIKGLLKLPGVVLYGDYECTNDRVGVIPFNLQDIPPNIVAEYLANNHAIAVRHGAFCAHPYVSRLTNEAVQGCNAPGGMIRVSFGIYNNEADINALLSAVKEILNLES
ncbi:MAG: aminotransferase class V-fold PLP-dependent enzyme [Defluviitaleaceae bacterium]|nr:aminotransferase class V-fold PLP-dependent enzyme [Defluviitaleaceae bacterium]